MNVSGEIYPLREIYNLPNTVIAEEFIDGNEYSAEGIVIEGIYCLIGLTKKYTVEGDFFDETAHVFPAPELIKSKLILSGLK